MLLFYCLLIVLASLLGGWLPTLVRLTHLRLQLILSAVAGVMLVVATLHLVPHAALLMRSIQAAMVLVLIGVLFMFVLNRMLHFHLHDVAESNGSNSHDHDRVACTHVAHIEGTQQLKTGDVSSVGLLSGMMIHTLIDGIALGAANMAHSGSGWSASDFSVFLAIVLHKPLDSMSVTSLMMARRWSASTIALANIAIALMAPVGVLLFTWGIGLPSANGNFWVGASLAFAAGVFLCISLGDLLPEVHFHKHDRVWLSAALLLGIAISAVIELLPGHSHRNGVDSNPIPTSTRQ